MAQCSHSGGNRRITLDGMRGTAAVLVAFYHFQQRIGVEPIHGYLAVDLFFVLSGFVLTEAYTRRFAAGLSWRRFVGQRFWRFYPLYAVALPLGIVWQLWGHVSAGEQLSPPMLGEAIGLGLFMLPNIGGTLYPLNGAAWSLAFELGVNLLMAVLLWRLRSRALLLVMLISFCILTLTSHDPQHMNMGWRRDEAGGAIARTVFSFVAGMVIQRHVGRWRLNQPWTSPLLVAGALLPPLLLPGGPWEDMWELLVIALVFPALLTLGAAVEPPPILARPMVWLGNLSFPLYAIHWPLAALVVPWLTGLPFWTAVISFGALAMALAWIADRWFDRPIQARLRKRQHQDVSTAPLNDTGSVDFSALTPNHA